jgi:two-component system, NtrC family, sensor kinase
MNAYFCFLIYTNNFFLKRNMLSQENIQVNQSLLQAVDKFKTSLFTMNDTGKICSSIVTFLNENLSTKNVKVYILREEGAGFFPFDQESDESSKFTLFNLFILWLADHDGIYSIYELLKKEKPEIVEIITEISQIHQVSHIIPLIMNSSLIGFIFFQSEIEEFSKFQKECLFEVKTISVMAISNASFYEKLIQLTETLEQKVKERTKELEDAQSQLVVSEKMASLGVMVAGIAHEINTPTGVISNSSENLGNNLDYIFSHLTSINKIYNSTPELIAHFEEIIKQILNQEQKVNFDSREKIKIKKRLRESLKLEGFDSKTIEDITLFLVDRNLLNLESNIITIVKFLGLDSLNIIENFAGMHRNLSHIRYSIKNIVRIIRALKYYSHLDQAREEEANIAEGIENTLIIMSNQLKHDIEVIKDLKDVPKILCNPDELNQVWTNLIQNAIHAMKGKGTLSISLYEEGEYVGVEIKDSGSGIPQEIIEKIWDPFFTTKDQGQGTGLGLGIVKGIIDKHKGKTIVQSSPGSTSFKISLPINKNGLIS